MPVKWLLIAAAAVHLAAASSPPEPITTIDVGVRENAQTGTVQPSPPKLTPEQSERINFGKYTVPPTLQSLLDLRQELGDPERLYDAVYFFVNTENFRYFSTPSDVVVFGNVGVDGVHYGFLTDYGTVADLEEAPIVCISPMDFDRPVRIVAKNLKDFLRLSLTDANLVLNPFGTEAEYLAAQERWAEEEKASPYQRTEEEKQARLEVIHELQKRISLPELGLSAFSYVQKTSEERGKQVTIRTLDGLGVTTPLEQGRLHEEFKVSKDEPIDLSKLKAYLAGAPRASKLALLRDLQITRVLPNERELQPLLLEEMQRLGLKDEAARIQASY
ncbi:hypothetical protein ACVNS2_21145 [Paenibacillus caseinilyticus]|uniref:Uncharacterized protein n=1 Tax=Paenibacillus mucilaginosus K02 TaxID=997761 RepID=I0BLC2_9BACL|nr:hypothetical protein [Paenibacillus mucilaginosus]AFH63169.1 hypothetical protein B2K_21100 [Paenibacillus mucilaginosus K02]AFK65246.1 hypothetical protein [Paenibacillus mucilaginosus K02]